VKRTVVWVGLDASRSEIAHAIVDGGELRARGTQIGTDPKPSELRYELDGTRLAVELVGGAHREVELEDTDFFDLASSPLFNSLPVLRDGLHLGGRAHDYVMSWVDVPSLEVSRSEQRYEPIAPGIVRFRSGSFTADLEFSADGFVSRYPGLAKRVS
jgi:Putative glycolipid-binding